MAWSHLKQTAAFCPHEMFQGAEKRVLNFQWLRACFASFTTKGFRKMTCVLFGKIIEY